MAPIHPVRVAAERALDRCAADPQFEAALRGAYRGRHDVLDALWWAAHPLTVSPQGAADPAAELREAQRAVFSRSAEPAPTIPTTDPATGATVRMGAEEHRLQELQRLLAEDAEHLAAALDAAEPAAAVPAAADRSDLRVRDDGSQEEAGLIPSPDEPAFRIRRVLLPVLSGGALVAAILLLPSVTGDDGETGETPPLPTSLSEVPRITTEIVRLAADGTVPDPLGLLRRAQTDDDLPPDGFAMHQTSSYRKLPDLVGHVKLYLARDEEDTVCLVVLRNDGSGMSGCAEEAAFSEQGIRFSSEDRYPLEENATILTESFSLLGNGDFHYEARARVVQPYQPPR